MAEVLYKDGDTEIRIEQTHSIVDQDLFFFHSNEFIKRRTKSHSQYFNLYIGEKNVASIVFEVSDNTAISLIKSPFGGLITNELVDQNCIEKLLNTVTEYFQKQQIGIQIRIFPDCYYLQIKEIRNAFTNSGFLIHYIDTNQHISIDQQGFTKKINRNRKRKLDLCMDQRYVFKKLNNSYLEQSYQLITECRLDKGYPITMTLKELKASFISFPEHYILFGVFDKSDLIATAVSVKVNNKILYNFYHGDLLSYRKSSPVTLLIAGIYEYCQRQKFEILDLGISTDQGVMNEGLYYFKGSCGAISSDKVSYQLNWKI